LPDDAPFDHSQNLASPPPHEAGELSTDYLRQRLEKNDLPSSLSSSEGINEQGIPLTVRALLSNGQADTNCVISLRSIADGRLFRKPTDTQGQVVFYLPNAGPTWVARSVAQIEGTIRPTTGEARDWIDLPIVVNVKEKDNEVVSLWPTAASSISGFVRTLDGQGVPDVKISYHPDPFECNTVSSKTGAFTLRGVRPGQGSLFTDRLSPSIPFELLPGEHLETEITIPAPLTIRVKDEESGALLSQPSVFIENIDSDSSWGNSYFCRVGGSDVAQTRIFHPPAGKLRINVEIPPGFPYSPETIDVDWDGMNSRTITVALNHGLPNQIRLFFPSDYQAPANPRVAAWIISAASPMVATTVNTMIDGPYSLSNGLNVSFPKFPLVNGNLVVQVGSYQFSTPCWAEPNSLAHSLNTSVRTTNIKVQGWDSDGLPAMPLRLLKVSDPAGVPIPVPLMTRFVMPPTLWDDGAASVGAASMLNLPRGSYIVSIQDTLGRISSTNLVLHEGLQEVTLDCQFP